MTKSFPLRRSACQQRQPSHTRSQQARRSLACAYSRLRPPRRLFQARPSVWGVLLTLLSWQMSSHASGLLTEEEHVAGALASQVPWSDTAGKRVAHPLGVQTLFIEKQEDKHAAHARRARVYQYDYPTQAARLLVIDLENQTVIREQHIDSVHLPLSDQEIAFARTLLTQSDTLLTQLRHEQSLRGAVPFVSLDELDVKASIYEPLDSNDPCFVSRCALLSLFDATHTVFTTEPLIYLNSQQVGELHRR